MVAACGSARTPPADEGDSTRRAVATGGSEAPGAGDWTATARPLDEARTTLRPLGDEAPPPAGPVVAQAVAGEGSDNPAVTSLVGAAADEFRSGDYARAAATLERAIAIEPRNPWLWHRLAATRLAQERLEQAADLAAKSNALGTAHPRLQAGNWRLIGEVRRRQGNSAAAAAADARAAKLAQ